MSKWKVLLLVSATVVLTLAAANSWGQDNCVQFRGTIYGQLMPPWVGGGDFVIGKAEPKHADVVDVNTGMKRMKGNAWIGTETATFDFGKGDTFQLITQFTAQHMTDPAGAFHVNEVGTIANGTGRFANVSGHFTSHGPFGPALSADGQTWLWIGEYHGNICGVAP